MKALLIRSAEFEVVGDGRTLEGRAFRWETPSAVTDDGHTRYLEEFDRRSTDQTLRMRAMRPVFVEHQHELGSIGETTFTPSEEGLMFRARATDSSYARATMDRVRNGELPEVSVGFRGLRHLKRSDPRGLVTRRMEIAIAELSLTEHGQHAGGEILAVRAETGMTLSDLRRRRALLLI
jgi:HK97 family phage prohead protease